MTSDGKLKTSGAIESRMLMLALIAGTPAAWYLGVRFEIDGIPLLYVASLYVVATTRRWTQREWRWYYVAFGLFLLAWGLPSTLRMKGESVDWIRLIVSGAVLFTIPRSEWTRPIKWPFARAPKTSGVEPSVPTS